jgi:hypothetical protein
VLRAMYIVGVDGLVDLEPEFELSEARENRLGELTPPDIDQDTNLSDTRLIGILTDRTGDCDGEQQVNSGRATGRAQRCAHIALLPSFVPARRAAGDYSMPERLLMDDTGTRPHGDAGEPIRTVAQHGITGAELNRLGTAVRFMGRLSDLSPRHQLWWVTTNKETPRDTIADVWKRIGKLQGRHGLPKYSVLTFETRGGTHAHIIFIGNNQIARRLNSSAFGGLVAVAPATNEDRLVRKYLAKERTAQAGYRRHDLGGRLPGSHRLAGGGDRVRLSRELERDGIEGGYIEPWMHTNAKRQQAGERKSYRPRRLTRRSLVPAGQLSILPEIERRPTAPVEGESLLSGAASAPMGITP